MKPGASPDTPEPEEFIGTTGRIVVLALFCLPSWAVLNLMGPLQLFEGIRIPIVATALMTLAAAGFIGLARCVFTTPIAVFLASFFAVKAKSAGARIVFVAMGLSALPSMLIGLKFMR